MSAAQEISGRTFSITVMGYDRTQVDDFRDEMATTIGRLRARIHDLEHHLREHERTKPITADQAFANVARETQRILTAAQDAGARIVQQAREEAEQEIAAARQQHSQILGDGYRARDEIDDHIGQLDQARARLLAQLHDASANIDRVCAALEAQTAPPDRRQRELPEGIAEPPAEALVEHRRTGTEHVQRAARAGERALRVVGEPGRRERGARDRPAVRSHATARAAQTTPGGLLAAKRDRLAPLRAALIDQLHHDLQRVREDVRERLRSGGDDGAVRFDEAQLAPVARAGRDLLAEAFTLGAATAATALGIEPATGDHERDELLALLDERVATPVSTLIEHSVAAEDPPWVVAERVDGIFADASEAMVAEITDTELSRAYERGMLATWSEGSVTARRWIFSQQGHRRDDQCHRNAEAAAVPIGEPFPSGDHEPPRFSGCSCTTVAVMADPEENDPQ